MSTEAASSEAVVEGNLEDAGNNDENAVGIFMCDSCYNNASEIEGDEAKCDVCLLRDQLAECRQQVVERDTRIAELEAKLSKSSKVDEDEEASGPQEAPDVRPHMIAISDGMFTKMRKYPHAMFVHLGRVPRTIWRSKVAGGVQEMYDHLLIGLNNNIVEGRTFHVLWFGGLADTTLENYERAAYVTQLQELLEKVRDHEKVTSVTWATLPETNANAEAREINERIAAWLSDKSDIRILDLRYISRREGTMETNEAMWTPKGGLLIGESLKKFLIEKLNLDEADQKVMEETAKEMQLQREKRAKKMKDREEGQLRKQQKLARAALLKAGHPVPGVSGSKPFVRRNGSSGGNSSFTKAPPRKFASSGPSNGTKFAPPPLGPPGGFKGKFNGPPKSSFPMRNPEYSGASGYDRLPPPSTRLNPEYLEDPRCRNLKRPRVSDPSYDTFDRYGPSPGRMEPRGPGPFEDMGTLYSRREDPFRRSPPRGHDLPPMAVPPSSAPYGRPYGGPGGAGGPGGDMRRPQWMTYDRRH